jgi:hypothetical protein
MLSNRKRRITDAGLMLAVQQATPFVSALSQIGPPFVK